VKHDALPVIMLLAAAGLAWRRSWVGAASSIGWSAWYLAESWGRFPMSVYAIVIGSPFLVGALFALDWWYGANSSPPPSRSPEVV